MAQEGLLCIMIYISKLYLEISGVEMPHDGQQLNQSSIPDPVAKWFINGYCLQHEFKELVNTERVESDCNV